MTVGQGELWALPAFSFGVGMASEREASQAGLDSHSPWQGT